MWLRQSLKTVKCTLLFNVHFKCKMKLIIYTAVKDLNLDKIYEVLCILDSVKSKFGNLQLFLDLPEVRGFELTGEYCSKQNTHTYF